MHRYWIDGRRHHSWDHQEVVFFESNDGNRIREDFVTSSLHVNGTTAWTKVRVRRDRPELTTPTRGAERLPFLYAADNDRTAWVKVNLAMQGYQQSRSLTRFWKPMTIRESQDRHTIRVPIVFTASSESLLLGSILQSSSTFVIMDIAYARQTSKQVYVWLH